MLDVSLRPDAFSPARRELLQEGVPVVALLLAVDPPEAEGLVERLGVGDRGPRRALLRDLQPHPVRRPVVPGEPGTPAARVRELEDRSHRPRLPCAARRPDSAASSALPGRTTSPAAQMPATAVRPSPSTSGAKVPSSGRQEIFTPAWRSSSKAGVGGSETTTASQSTRRLRPPASR